MLRETEELLDLEKGIADPRPGNACQRWPEGQYLVNAETGEVCQGCCKATNLCDCARARYLSETTRMLALDAAVSRPVIFVVLTAREHLVKDRALSETMRQLLRAARKRWPATEWFQRWEEQERGALHVNLLVKGVPEEAVGEFRRLLSDRWCARVDAEDAGQYAEVILGDAVGYVSKKVRHSGKRNQEPHLRNKHRTSQTRGYFAGGAKALREEARRSLRLEQLQWRGLDVGAALDELARREAETWVLARRRPGIRWKELRRDGQKSPRAHERESTGERGRAGAPGSREGPGPRPYAVLGTADVAGRLTP